MSILQYNIFNLSAIMWQRSKYCYNPPDVLIPDSIDFFGKTDKLIPFVKMDKGGKIKKKLEYHDTTSDVKRYIKIKFRNQPETLIATKKIGVVLYPIYYCRRKLYLIDVEKYLRIYFEKQSSRYVYGYNTYVGNRSKFHKDAHDNYLAIETLQESHSTNEKNLCMLINISFMIDFMNGKPMNESTYKRNFDKIPCNSFKGDLEIVSGLLDLFRDASNKKSSIKNEVILKETIYDYRDLLKLIPVTKKSGDRACCFIESHYETIILMAEKIHDKSYYHVWNACMGNVCSFDNEDNLLAYLYDEERIGTTCELQCGSIVPKHDVHFVIIYEDIPFNFREAKYFLKKGFYEKIADYSDADDDDDVLTVDKLYTFGVNIDAQYETVHSGTSYGGTYGSTGYGGTYSSTGYGGTSYSYTSCSRSGSSGYGGYGDHGGHGFDAICDDDDYDYYNYTSDDEDDCALPWA